MAYGLRWFSEFNDVKGRICRVEIRERDYVGVATEVISGGDPFVVEYAEDYSSDPFTPIRPQKATIKWISDDKSGFDIKSLFITDDKKFEVNLYVAGKVMWAGFVSFTDCQEPYLSRPYPVTISAICGLSLLKRDIILDVSGKFFTDSIHLLTPIVDGLKRIGLGLSIADYIGLVDSTKALSSNYSFLGSINIDSDGLRGLTYFEYFEGVLGAANAYITQSNGVWVIKEVRGHTQSTITAREYDSNGNSSGTATYSQQVAILKPSDNDPLGPYLRPTADVIEKLASPKSKIELNVKPGVQVNRIRNGVLKSSDGTKPDDWTAHGYVIGRDISVGNGTPDDPYRIFMNWDSWSNQGWIEAAPIILNIEGYGANNTEKHNIKLKLQGFVKAYNTPYVVFKVAVNSEERVYGSYLTDTGEWSLKKKSQIGQIPALAGVNIPVKDGSSNYEDLDLLQFELESKPIINWVQSGGQWICVIRFILDMPRAVFNSGNGLPKVWFEDLSICIDTGTPFEGDHTYELDATNLILNGGEYSYDVLIGDKIGINTLEQKRSANRVMTGYLYHTILPTTSWQRMIDGAPDPEDPGGQPLLYLSMRERVRLLCGKRRQLEGLFLGFGLRPDLTVVNTIESTNPAVVTAYEWNVKYNQYRLSLFELEFAKLSNEEIKLVVEDESGRRSRMSVAGGVGSSSGSNTGVFYPIVIGDMPVVPGVLKQIISPVVIDIEGFLESENDPATLQLRLLTKPSWANVDIDQLVVTVTGKPDVVGEDQILIEVADGTGDEYIVSIPVIIFPITTVTYTLTPGGKLSTTTPKQIPYATDPRTATVEVDGGHDAHRVTLKGAGINLDTGLVEHGYSETATYSPFPAQALPEGIFDFAYIHYRITGTDPDSGDPIYTETHRSRAVIIHGENLGDSDPNRRAVVSLLSGGAILADITGTETILKYLEAWNLSVFPVGLLADKFVLTLMPEEEPYYKEMFPIRANITGATTAVKLNPADGTTTPDPAYQTTGLIPVSSGDRIWIYGTDLVAVGYNAGAYVDALEGPDIYIGSGITHIRVCSHTDPVKVERVTITPADFLLFAADTPKPAGKYSVFLKAFDDAGEEIYQKYGKFQILEKEKEVPEAAGGLKLISEGASVSVIAELPVTGGVYPLPTDGFDVIHEVSDTEVDKISLEAFRLVNGGWQAINIPLYTGYPSEIAYPVSVTEATIQAFGAKTSLQIGDIHEPGRFLFRFTDWLLGEKVGISESDFRFKPDTPVGPDSGMIFGYFYPASDAFLHVDEDLPTTGGYYLLPEAETPPKYWSVLFETFDGTTPYNRLVTEVEGTVAAEWTGAYTTARPDALFSEYFSWGTLVDGKRVVGGTNIDVPGMHTVVHKFYDGTTLLGQKSVTLELYEDVEDPEVKDPNECCSEGGGGDSLTYITDEWT